MGYRFVGIVLILVLSGVLVYNVYDFIRLLIIRRKARASDDQNKNSKEERDLKS